MTTVGRNVHDACATGRVLQLLPAGDDLLRVPNPRPSRSPGYWALVALLWWVPALLALLVVRPPAAWALPVLAAFLVQPLLVALLVLASDQVGAGRWSGGLLRTRVHAALAHAQLRRDEEKLHQVRSMVSGISLASRVLNGNTLREVPAVTRASLADMQRQEIQRLARLVCDEEPEPTGAATVELDRVLEPLVVAVRARGADVRWVPSGVSALGHGDEIAEVVQVLLENAERHAPGATVHLEVDASAADVIVRVTDTGAGLPPGEPSRVFDWGTRRPGSPGRGIGLSAARERARRLRGSLAFEPAATGGASFVLRLQPDPERIAPCPARSV